jgi:transcriptional regulator with XRE-family HTH domain
VGRRESPLREPQWRTAGFPLWKLAEHLRRVRRSAGLTYQELADTAHVPVGKLRRAADGKTLPEQATVEAYARGCGRDPGYAVRWRERAEKARQRKLRAVPRRPGSGWPKGLGRASKPWSLPEPGGARGIARAAARRAATFDTLVAALECLRLAAGKPTLKELAEAARQNGEWLLPSTASDMLRRKTRRPRREIVLTFARACGEPDEWLPEWEGGWSRASRAPAARPDIAAPAAKASRGVDDSKECGTSVPGADTAVILLICLRTVLANDAQSAPGCVIPVPACDHLG